MEFKDTQSQLDGIRKIFEQAATEDGWNLDEEMLFSYFFIGEDPDKLEELGIELEKQGYDFVDVFELGEEETNEPTGEFLLQIDKIEKHTPESLAARNVEFQTLAEANGAAFDGWEFGEPGDEDEEEEEVED